MKHDVLTLLKAAELVAAPGKRLLTAAELKDEMRAALDGSDAARTRLAARLEIEEGQLSWLLRSDRMIGPAIAERFGYRRVVRFERME